MKKPTMTLEDLERMDKACLTPVEVASVIGCDPMGIRWQAHDDPTKLRFQVIVVKRRMKIPRLAFIAYMRGKQKQ